MFNPNFIPENFDSADPAFLPNDFANFLPPTLDNFNPDLFSQDFQGFPMLSEFESIDTTNIMQMFDQAYQFFPEEIKQFIPFGFDYPMPAPEANDAKVLKFAPRPNFSTSSSKVGTITLEERRMKVLRFLEKRKRRNFAKKISYMCRKKVADQRIRVKGRFVSKVQASVILGVKTEDESKIGIVE